MALNSGPNQTKAIAALTASLNASLAFVTAELAAATAASNTALINTYTAEQTQINYQISLLTPNSVSGTATEGWQEDETTPYQSAWFPK